MSKFYNLDNKIFAETSGLTNFIIADLKSRKLLPRGSALITSSGKLSPDITVILHAATGTMNGYSPEEYYYEPSLQSIEDSIEACFELAKINGNKRLAIPYIGGRIFKNRIFHEQGLTENEQDEKLVACVIASSLNYASSTNLDYCFVSYDHPTYVLFNNELIRSHGGVDISEHLKVGDIIDFKLHNCDAIINAANMEVEFGDGISGAIAKGTQDKDEIDKEAKCAINKFWAEYESQL